MAVAGAMLQRDAPLPAGVVRGGTRERVGRPRTGGWQSPGPVHRQPVAPVLVTRLQRFLNQQAAKAGAIDEQLPRNGLAVVEADRNDIATIGIAANLLDLAFDSRRPLPFRKGAKILRIEAGVEVIGVANFRERWTGRGVRSAEPRHGGRRRTHGIVRDQPSFRAAQPFFAQVKLVKGNAVQILSEMTEWVDIPVAFPAPVHEFDAEFECAPRGGEELVLGDAQHRVEFADRRNRRLADAHGSDGVAFDQNNAPPPVVEVARQRGGDHPTRGASTDDDDVGKPLRVTVTF